MDNEGYKTDFERANNFLKQGDFNQSIKEFEIILKRWPNDSKSFNKLGICYVSIRKYKEARLYLREAIKIDLQYAEPYNNLGNICLENKEYEKAIELYKKALELNPEYAAAHSNLGLVYKRINKIDKAVRHFKKAAKIDRIITREEMQKLKKRPKDKNNFAILILIVVCSVILFLLFKK